MTRVGVDATPTGREDDDLGAARAAASVGPEGETGVDAMLLFVAQVLLYATFPFAFAFFRRDVRLVLYHAYIAMVLTIGGFMGAVYALEILPGTRVSAGSLLYGALILTVFMLVAGGHEVRVISHVVKIVIGVNIFKIGFLLVTATALGQPATINPHDTSASVFTLSLTVVLVGGAMIVGELVLLIVAFEAIRRRVRRPAVKTLLEVLLFVGVLVADGALFPVLAAPGEATVETVLAGVRAKTAIGLAYSVPLVAFIAVVGRRRSAVAQPLKVVDLFRAPRAELVQQVERQSRELAAGAERYRLLVESTADAVVGVDLEGRVTSWNPAAVELYGLTAAEAVGRHCTVLMPVRGIRAVEAVLARAMTSAVTELDTVVRREDGYARHVSLTVSPVRSDGQVVGLSVIGRDTTESHQLQAALEHQTLHDALTGLPNRTLFLDRLEQRLADAGRVGDQVAVMFLDLDQFKVINDGSGHDVGDDLLKAVAERLGAAVRPGDTVARHGGDEFVLLCPVAGAEQARELADHVLAELSHPVTVRGQRVYVTASLGIAIGPPGDPATLLRQADAAMYSAKARGRSHVQLFDASMSSLAENRLVMAGELREALEAQQLELWYQPIIDLRSGRLTALEALSRWDHPRLGRVAPSVFVPLTESSGMITTLSSWALNRAGADGAVLLRAGTLPPDGRLAVNLSAHDFTVPGLLERVRSAVEAADGGFGFDNLTLEVTESVLMIDVDRSIELLTALRDLGVRIAVDDFGTGYSSLSYLRRFPVGEVKIDRAFIQGITEIQEDRAVVQSVVQLAHSLGIRTVAEGVEEEAQRDMLVGMGCDVAQGYLWSPALGLADVLRWRSERSRGGQPGVAARPSSH